MYHAIWLGNLSEFCKTTSRWGLTASINYIDGYRDTLSVPTRRVSAWATIDGQIRYRPRWQGWLDGTSLSLSVQNLLDTDPPFVNRPSGQAYDATNADPLGRFVALQIIRSF